MYSLILDFRFSLRLMRKQAGFTFWILAALILGMGLNTAVFSVVNAVLLRPLPIFQPERVLWLHSVVNQTGAQLGTSYPDFLDWREQSHSFDSMAAMYFFSATLSGYHPPEHIKAMAISASGFKVWGIQTALGRDFDNADDEPSANRVAIVSHNFWQRKFGGDTTVPGNSLTLDGRSYVIIGVLQPTPIAHLNYADVYVTNGPLLANSTIAGRESRWFFPVARLKAFTTVAEAQAEMETITRRLAAAYPAADKDYGVRLEAMTENLTKGESKPLLLLILASNLIFLLAATNVTTAFLATTLERGREISIRSALGAPRLILFRQIFVQASLFATIGAAAGLLLAKYGVLYFLHRFPNAALRFNETNIDLRVIGLTAAMAFGTTLLASIPPVIYTFPANIGAQLRREPGLLLPQKSRTLVRTIFLLTEVALAFALSLAAALLIKSFYELEKVDLGFTPQGIFSFRVTPTIPHYNESAKLSALYMEAIDKLENAPGINSASGISSLPLTGHQLTNALYTGADSPFSGKQVLVEDESILPRFFKTLGIPILQGRDFSDADHDGVAPVVIVDDVLAAKLWPGTNPLGKRIQMSPMIGHTKRWLEVVGVVREIKHFGPERPVKWMQIYVPQYQDPSPALSFVLTASAPAGAIRTAANKALHDLDNELPIEDFGTLDAYLDNFLSGRKITLLLLSIFAGIGILLGAVGVYAVAANTVTERHRELAIRMALGAMPQNTIALVMRHGVLTTLGGIVIGSVVVLSLARLLGSVLYGVSPLDPRIYALSAILLILLAIIATLIPAVRVWRFNIQKILRQ